MILKPFLSLARKALQLSLDRLSLATHVRRIMVVEISMSMNKPIIDTKNCWLDINTVAKLKNVTIRAVRLAIRNKKYIARTKDQRGGKSYEILLESLEPDLQTKYIQECYQALVSEEIDEPLHPINKTQEKIIQESAKKIFKEEGKLVLLARYKGMNRRKTCIIDSLYVKFRDLYLSSKTPTMAHCYKTLKEEFDEE